MSRQILSKCNLRHIAAVVYFVSGHRGIRSGASRAGKPQRRRCKYTNRQRRPRL